MEEDNEYCEKHCKGYRDTGGRCFFDDRCAAYQNYQKQKETMAQVKATEAEQPEKKTVDLIPEERLQEILNILLPYGYSHYDNKYTGVSPYIGDSTNIITIVANDPKWSGYPFSICMERFAEDEELKNCLGFYKGIMKVIAPELHSEDDKFDDIVNVLDFDWADDKVQDNRFPVTLSLRN